MKLYKQYTDEQIVQRIPEEDILIEFELVSALTNLPIVSFFEDRKVWESLEQARLSDTTSFRTEHAYYYWVEDLKGEDLKGVYSELHGEELPLPTNEELGILDYDTALSICRDLLGDDLDGIQSSMEDGMYLGLVDDDGDLFGDLYGE